MSGYAAGGLGRRMPNTSEGSSTHEEGNAMNTRTIAIAALVIAVILLIIFLA